MTSSHDIALAVEAGADAVGVILAESPRRVRARDLPELRAAIPPFVTAVAVVAGESARSAPELTALGFIVQFSGREPAAECERLAGGRPYVKAFHVGGGETYERGDSTELDRYAHALWMFDTASALRYGGSGRTFDWQRVADLAARRPVVVSGGLTADNVAQCVRAVRPYAVDVRSGIETGGHKDERKMRAFVRAVREADAEA